MSPLMALLIMAGHSFYLSYLHIPPFVGPRPQSHPMATSFVYVTDHSLLSGRCIHWTVDAMIALPRGSFIFSYMPKVIKLEPFGLSPGP